MEITIKTKGNHHPESNKTLTILSAFIVAIILIAVIGYGIYSWANKPATTFVPVKNKTIGKLLQDSEEVKAETIQKKGKVDEADRVLKRLKQECQDRKLANKDGNILSNAPSAYSEAIETALATGEEAAKEIKNFQEKKRASKQEGKNAGEKKAAFRELVHKIIKTPADQPKEVPTRKQIQDAFDQLVENLKTAQTAWDEGKEGDKSYEEIYICCKLVSQYTRIKLLVDNNKSQADNAAG